MRCWISPGPSLVASGPRCKRATGVGSLEELTTHEGGPTPVAPRVSPTETIRAEIHELFADGGELLSVIEQVARLSVRLTFQSVIEEIVCEELGRGRYERRGADSPEGYRNGWQQPRTLQTSLGPVELQRPKLRHAHAALCDRLFGQGVTRPNALETLVISCWVRGLSDRDVEAMLVEVFGQDAGISRTTASRICQRLRAEFDTWCHRDLSGTRIDYLYLDGSFFKMHPKAKAEPVLVAWGIDTDGKPCFLALAPSAAESTDAWRALLTDLTDRRRAKRFIAKWAPLYPAAVACVADNLDALTVHLLFPAEHRQRIRHSNLIERTFGETRRRVKVIGRLPGEQSCLSLVWAVLDRASKGWRGLTMTPKALRRLQDLRREVLHERPEPRGEEGVAETVTAAA